MRFADLSVGDELLTCTRVVTREDVKAYAEAGGDQNPLHQDDAFARSVGFDGIIAHGMFTMGHLARCVTEWARSAEVVRLKAQFRAPVLMGETITAGGRIKGLDPATRTASLELWVTVERGGGAEHAIRRAEADVRFPA